MPWENWNEEQLNCVNKSWEFLFVSSNEVSELESEFQYELDSLNKFRSTIDLGKDSPQKLPHFISDFEDSEIFVGETKKIKVEFSGLVEKNVVWQSKNTIKFMMRLFIKYHKIYDPKGQDSERVIEVSKTYRKLYGTKQGKITLLIYKHLFYLSKFSLKNRTIFHRILGDKEILKKEIFENGNVKRKGKYLYSMKVMRIRCISGNLSSRTEDH